MLLTWSPPRGRGRYALSAYLCRRVTPACAGAGSALAGVPYWDTWRRSDVIVFLLAPTMGAIARVLMPSLLAGDELSPRVQN